MSRDIDGAEVEDEEVLLKVIELDLERGPVLEHELGLELGPGLGHDCGLDEGIEPELELPADLFIWGDSWNFRTGGVGFRVIIWKIVSIEKLSAPQIPSKLLSLRHFSCLRATRYWKTNILLSKSIK